VGWKGLDFFLGQAGCYDQISGICQAPRHAGTDAAGSTCHDGCWLVAHPWISLPLDRFRRGDFSLGSL